MFLFLFFFRSTRPFRSIRVQGQEDGDGTGVNLRSGFCHLPKSAAPPKGPEYCYCPPGKGPGYALALGTCPPLLFSFSWPLDAGCWVLGAGEGQCCCCIRNI
jgi:hypothetical protein